MPKWSLEMFSWKTGQSENSWFLKIATKGSLECSLTNKKVNVALQKPSQKPIKADK